MVRLQLLSCYLKYGVYKVYSNVFEGKSDDGHLLMDIFNTSPPPKETTSIKGDGVTVESFLRLTLLHLRSIGDGSQSFEFTSGNLCVNLQRCCQWEYIYISSSCLK